MRPFASDRKDCRALDSDHALGDDIAGEQQAAEGDDHDRGADLDAAHRQHAIAGARVGEPFGPGFGADGDFITSLMAPVTEIGEFASWISAPKVGIDNKPGDFEYVKIEH